MSLGRFRVALGPELLTSHSEEKLNFLNWHVVFGQYNVVRAFGGSTCQNFCFSALL